MFLGGFPRKLDRATLLKQLGMHMTMFGIWMAAVVRGLELSLSVLHYLCEDKEELKLDL
uniref:Uncharacterized protein n=1 Tax=Nelumbo nucifera TaxID=4432 RepID=A0A822Z7L6_NELNU|nr:TPA_asm: hypothetical protein HUJ06_014923 [Nelumbo nucifera]